MKGDEQTIEMFMRKFRAILFDFRRELIRSFRGLFLFYNALLERKLVIFRKFSIIIKYYTYNIRYVLSSPHLLEIHKK